MIEIRYPFKEVATPNQDITIGLKESTPMDELLHERLEELKKIDERIQQMMRWLDSDEPVGFLTIAMELKDVHSDISVMIQRAEEDYRKF